MSEAELKHYMNYLISILLGPGNDEDKIYSMTKYVEENGIGSYFGHEDGEDE